jgi:thiamine-monophosphate kinase
MGKNIGEFDYIKNLINKLPKTGQDVITGAGLDDAGVIKISEDQYMLATTDALVDGVHFTSKVFRPEEVGRKAIAVNVSDIAAMGAKPTYCLVSLVFPKTLDENYKTRLYDGIIEECKRYDIQIIGGNISRGQEIVVDIFLLGKTTPDRMLSRSGAKVGDKLLVTGFLGQAAAGLQLLTSYAKKKEILRQFPDLISKQLTPTPRLKEALTIAQTRLATSMIDISDGLAQDIGHICNSSSVGVKIYEDKLPISIDVKDAAKMTGKTPLELALSGGEDYELCFTIPNKSVEKIISKIEHKTKTPVNIVGEILSKESGQLLVLKNGEIIPLQSSGWDHFVLDAIYPDQVI